MIKGIIGPIRRTRFIKADKPNIFGDWYYLPKEVLLYGVIINDELVLFESLPEAQTVLGKA